MSSKPPLPCDQLHEDDGLDAARRRKRRGRTHDNPRRAARKAAQLGAQIQQSVDLSLLSEFDDLDLQDLRVLEILPLQGDAHFLIRLAPPADEQPRDLSAIQDRLNRSAPFLRSEVAGDIHRKKTPRLSFLVVPAPEYDDPSHLEVLSDKSS